MSLRDKHAQSIVSQVHMYALQMANCYNERVYIYVWIEGCYTEPITRILMSAVVTRGRLANNWELLSNNSASVPQFVNIISLPRHDFQSHGYCVFSSSKKRNEPVVRASVTRISQVTSHNWILLPHEHWLSQVFVQLPDLCKVFLTHNILVWKNTIFTQTTPSQPQVSPYSAYFGFLLAVDEMCLSQKGLT